MICANCGAENRPGRRFCLRCGTSLGLPCANCGAENEPDAGFCGNCGRPLGAPAELTAAGQPPVGAQPSAAPARAPERRLVTVMFADLVGFTPFAENRDAEDVRATLERYSALAREIVARYGGTVEKFIGDAVMAVWGTPTAHEDDAERAVRAALEIVDSVQALGPEISARAGVLSGEAAVNLAATDQALLAGDLVNTAARLQAAAPPGQVLVGEATMQAASAAITFEPAGEQALKGKVAPVPAWRAVRVVAQRRGAGRSEALETPFVGRDEEFRLLRELLHSSGRDPRTRLVSVTGPAGIGKSRLAWELEKYVDGIVENVYWHRGRCPAYGDGVSFWALGEMVRSRAGLVEGDDEPTTRERLAATLADFVDDEAEREWIGQALLVLLGAEQQAGGGRETLFAAWRRFFESIAARGTTVLVFEDLHWADVGLLDFIDHLLEWSKSVPLLVVTLARPELFDRRSDWGAGHRTFTAVALDPLPEAAMRELLIALVPNLPAAAIDAIVARADGIPLYAVETVRMLIADGRLEAHDGTFRATGALGDLEVPASLRSLITSRLDGLEADDRRLIQEASILGLTFSAEALAAVAGVDIEPLIGRLRQLVRRELLTVEADPRSPERGQYAFVQSLIREVAYATLARADRRRRHLAAARHYEAVGGDETAGILAGHYVAAHAASTAGPEADAVAAQARVALRAAAERAAALAGHRQAAAYLEQALLVTPDLVERAPLLERLAGEQLASGSYDAAETSARAAIDALAAGPDGQASSAARGRGLLGTILINAGRIAPAAAELQIALETLGPAADPADRAYILVTLARAQYRLLDTVAAIASADAALEIAEHNRLLTIIAEALVAKGTAMNMRSRPHEAIALLEAGRQLAKREGAYAAALRAAANLGAVMASEVGNTEAMEIGRDALATARALGDRGQIVWQVGNLMIGGVFAGEPLEPLLSEADELLALDLAPADRDHLLESYVMVGVLSGRDMSLMMADFRLAAQRDPQRGRDVDFHLFFVELAAGDYRSAAAAGERHGAVEPALGMMTLAALAAAMSGDPVRTRALLDKCASLPVSGRSDAAMRLAVGGLLLCFDGRTNEGLTDLREAVRELRALTDVLQRGLLALAMVRVIGPQQAEARALGEEALADFERMGARPLVEQVRAALAAAPDQLPAGAGQALTTQRAG